MIRQAISCDMCGAEMQHANHWFVAYENGGELRMGEWNPRARLRTGAKHLCGQTCLHKLMDDFVARTRPARVQAGKEQPVDVSISVPHAVAKRTAPRASSASVAGVRTMAAMPQPVLAVPVAAPPVSSVSPSAGPVSIGLVSAEMGELESSARLIPTPAAAEEVRPLDSAAEPAGFAARNWHAEAWKREREREQRSSEHHTRRRSIA